MGPQLLEAMRRRRFGTGSRLAAALLTVLLSLAVLSPAMAERVALVIGNGAYVNANQLTNPPKDAAAIAAKLRELKFDVTLAEDATLEGMNRALATFSLKATKAEAAVIFYAGHGLQVDGENYLIPVDASLKSRDDLRVQALQASEIYKELVAAQPELAVLILDACRDNPFAAAIATSPGLATGSVSASAFVQRPDSAGMLIGFAAAPGAVAYDGGDGNSPYTTALLQWIDRPGLELGTMLRRVRSTVVDLTRGAQVPWVEEALLREVYLYPGDPTLMAKADEGDTVQMALLQTIRALDRPEEREVAAEFYDRLLLGDDSAKDGQATAQDEETVRQGLIWLSIRRSSDQSLFKKYVEAFPQSPFAAAAQDRMAMLQQEEAEKPIQVASVEPGVIILGDTTIEVISDAEPSAAVAALPAAEPIGAAAASETGSQTVALATGSDAVSTATDAVTAAPASDEAQAAAPSGEVVAAAPATDGATAATASDTATAVQATDHAAAATATESAGGTLVLGEGTAQTATGTDGAVTAVEPGADQEKVAALEPAGSPAVQAKPADQPTVVEPNVQQASLAPVPAEPSEVEAELGLGKAELAAVQALLSESGNYKGKFDASYGPGTRKAIKAFQADAGVGATGYLDQDTLQLLVRRHGGAVLRGKLDDGARDAVHMVAAVAAGGAGAKPVTLRVAAISRNDEVHVYRQELAAAFEAAHPGTRVKFTHQPDYEYKASLLGMLGSDEPPDVIHTWSGGHLKALADAGFARDLTDEMSRGWALEFRPGALQNYTENGRIYGAPDSIALVSLWVNSRMLAEAGVAPEQLSTWDGFIDGVKKLKQAGMTPLAIGGKDKWTFQMILGNLIEQTGRATVDAAIAGQGDGFRAAAIEEAARRLADLAALDPFQEGYETTDEGEAGKAFSQGRTAMVITGNWRLNTWRWNWNGGQDRMRAELRRLDFPGMTTAEGKAMTYGGSDGYAVNAKSPPMAVELLRVLTSRAVQTKMAELADVVPAVSGSDLTVADPVIGEVGKALLATSYHQLYLDQVLGPDVGEVLNNAAAGIAEGTLAPAEAMRQVDVAWNEVLVSRGEKAPQ